MPKLSPCLLYSFHYSPVIHIRLRKFWPFGGKFKSFLHFWIRIGILRRNNQIGVFSVIFCGFRIFGEKLQIVAYKYSFPRNMPLWEAKSLECLFQIWWKVSEKNWSKNHFPGTWDFYIFTKQWFGIIFNGAFIKKILQACHKILIFIPVMAYFEKEKNIALNSQFCNF